MISYRDITFCPFWDDCAQASACHRPLTLMVRDAAKEAGLPIAQFVDRPDCHIAASPNPEQADG